MALPDSEEFFHGFELSKETPTYTWTFNDEEDDKDFMMHTLFIKNAILGVSAVKGERNIVQIETKNFTKNDIKQPLLSLTLGQLDMCNLDVSFGHETPVTFRLLEGNGPVVLGGQHLVEFPAEDELSQDESALDDETEDDDLEEDEEEEVSPLKASKKRKAAVQAKDKAKKGKLDDSSAGDSVEDEEDDDEDDDEEEMEDEEESSPDSKKKKKGKAQGKKGLKTTKVSPKKAATKKGGKKKDAKK